MNFTVAAIVALVGAVLSAVVWAFRAGTTSGQAQEGRDRAQAETAGAAERVEMAGEANRIEADVKALTEAELEKELSTWSGSQH